MDNGMKIFSRACVLCVFTLVVSASAAGAVSYGYDEQLRLVRVEYADGKVLSYSYDAAGNRLSAVVAEAVSTSEDAEANQENAEPAPGASD